MRHIAGSDRGTDTREERPGSPLRIVEKLIGVLALLRQSRAEVVSLAELNVDLKSDLAWMSATWRKLVFGLPADGMVAGTVYRKYFELSILQQVRNDLRSGEGKLIKYSHLVANMVCLRNVQSMSEVIRQLREEGMEITPEMLSFLSPYRTWHINRFGDYVMDFERPSAPMNPDIKIFQ